MTSVPSDYLERVYAGVLGKIIGVYLGRPFEGWSHRDILAKLGEVDYYVHDRLNVPLVVTDDDISGTFTFLRAMPDYDYARDLTPAQIGQTWLNYIIENRTILWWGGLGMSTEHSAFLRLKHGIQAPQSGSIATNGQVVAEQIGAQIFIDGWGLIHPGDPERASDFARRAGSVSHDGEAIYAAQVVAALVAQAFVESDIHALLDTAVGLIPRDCLIARMISDIREWHAQDPDWKHGFAKIEGLYGYDKYGGNCHTVPNHAIIIHALLHSGGSFSRALMIANTCGWDTDCNSGNVGCIMGVRGGLDAIDRGPDWRGPVADKIYLPTADGGRCVTDAVQEAVHVANIGRAFRGLEQDLPKNGARFHFSVPGSVQGFRCENPESASLLNLCEDDIPRCLAIRLKNLACRVSTETFPLPESRKMPGYQLMASPTLYSGQTVRLQVRAAVSNPHPIIFAPFVSVYDENDELRRIEGLRPTSGSPTGLAPGESLTLSWEVPSTDGYPVAEVGLEIAGMGEPVVHLDWLTWDGAPDVTFKQVHGKTWKEQWVCGVSEHATWGEPFRLVQNEGTGLLMTGCREWTDYRVEASVTPHLVVTGGIAARVQGMKRYYALVLKRGGGVRLVKALDGELVLTEAPFSWELGETHHLALQVEGNHLAGFLNGEKVLEYQDDLRPLTAGGVALILTEGRMATQEVKVSPAF